MAHQAGAGGAFEDALQFLTREEAATLDAVSARLIPGDAGSPGAREARAVIYIDRTLAGYFSNLQVLYREGIESLERLSLSMFAGRFATLRADQQDDVLRIAENPQHPDASERLAQFFAVILEHTLEGTFGDPIHGGNRDAVGWKLIGFPGAQWGYTAEQMAPGFDARTLPTATLADVQARRRT